MQTDEERRQAERIALVAEEQRERAARQSGVVVFVPTAAESQTMAQEVRIAAMSLAISKTTIAVKVFRDGKPQLVEQEIGNYDWILQANLNQRSRTPEATR